MKKIIDMNLKKELALRIRDVRNNEKLKQSEFADSLSVSRAYINRVESLTIEVWPKEELLCRICNVYNVNYEWLLNGNGEMYKEINEEVDENMQHITVTDDFIEQTVDYFSLKSETLLKRNKMSDSAFTTYVKVSISFINMFFRMLADIKSSFENGSSPSDEIKDKYIKEFTAILKSI